MNVNFVERLRRLISDHAGGKPTVFAKKAGIPPGTFANYLEGRLPQADQLLRIRETYGINIDWLLTGEGEVYNHTKVDRMEETPPEIMGLLIQARRVLMSGNDVAIRALRHNITYFSRAIEAEHQAEVFKREAEESRRIQTETQAKLDDMEARLAKLEGDSPGKKESTKSDPDPDAATDAKAVI